MSAAVTTINYGGEREKKREVVSEEMH